MKPISKVLLVDDDRSLLQSMGRALSKQPFKLLLAGSGEEALRTLSAQPVDVVVSDERMPQMQGTELLAQVALQHPETVRISLTGQARIETEQRAIQEGQVYRFLTKPVDASELAKVINEGLAQREVTSLETKVNHDCRLADEAALLEHLQGLLPGASSGFQHVLFLIGVDRLRKLAGSLEPETERSLTYMIGTRLKADSSITLDLNPITSTLDLHMAVEGPTLRSKSVYVAQTAADEFAVILELPVGQDPSVIAGALSRSLERAFWIDDRALYLFAQLGVISKLQDYTKAESALRDARCALSNVRSSKTLGNIEVFDAEIRSAAKRQMKLESDFKSALEAEELQVFYQPLIGSSSTEVLGVEALLRWRHPQHGWMHPQRIVEIAEDLGQMHRLSMRILDTACRQQVAWRARGRPIKMSVNISCSEFEHPRFAQHVLTTVQRTEIEPCWLQLELTESVMIAAPERAMDIVKTLRKSGIRIALDDFGTGYSSLSYLRMLRPDTLKIDKSFVDDVLTDPVAAHMLEGIVNIAQRLNLCVVAEGVETEAQHKYLNSVGCDELQGYLFSKPAEPKDLDDLIFGVTR